MYMEKERGSRDWNESDTGGRKRWREDTHSSYSDPPSPPSPSSLSLPLSLGGKTPPLVHFFRRRSNPNGTLDE